MQLNEQKVIFVFCMLREGIFQSLRAYFNNNKKNKFLNDDPGFYGLLEGML